MAGLWRSNARNPHPKRRCGAHFHGILCVCVCVWVCVCVCQFQNKSKHTRTEAANDAERESGRQIDTHTHTHTQCHHTDERVTFSAHFPHQAHEQKVPKGGHVAARWIDKKYYIAHVLERRGTGAETGVCVCVCVCVCVYVCLFVMMFVVIFFSLSSLADHNFRFSFPCRSFAKCTTSNLKTKGKQSITMYLSSWFSRVSRAGQCGISRFLYFPTVFSFLILSFLPPPYQESGRKDKRYNPAQCSQRQNNWTWCVQKFFCLLYQFTFTQHNVC